MLERPHGPDLLATAREAVMLDLLPALPPEKQLVARMVAAAIALALREEATDPAPLLARLPGPDLPSLCRAIRAGAADPGAACHAAVRAWLVEYARARAKVSAPKALG